MEDLKKYHRVKNFLWVLWVLFGITPLILGSFENKEIYTVEPQYTPLGLFVKKVAGWIFFIVYFINLIVIGYLTDKK